MTLQKIAEAAGVSVSTVSRVINAAPGIAASTAENVHRAMQAMSYTPTRRRRVVRAQAANARGRRAAFLILEASTGITPAYDHLLRGVSAASNQFQLDLQVGFVDDPVEVIERHKRQRLDGLLLHGNCPATDVMRPLFHTPTVWLMGNSRRPAWGDQVMPDNVLVGQLAARYLLGRGHRHALYVGLRSGWSLGVRSLAFQAAMEDAGASAIVINPSTAVVGRPHNDEVNAVMHRMVRQYHSLQPKPTGLFVAEDWLLRGVYAALTDAGIRPGDDLDIISCNNDRPHLLGLDPMPATIDIRFERIAFHGVERLVCRMQEDETPERLRVLVEPVLVPPTSRTETLRS
jgi:LacI family transcriptional regulator